MGELIDVIEEIRLRLKAGIDANAIESAHDGVYVGSKARLMKMNDYPVVGIIIPSGDNTTECFPHGTTENTTIEIGYMIPSLQDDYNVLYKSSDSTGPMRNLEQIFNYIQLNRSTSAVDLQLAGTAYDAIKYRWNVQENPESSLLFFSITVNVKCAKYTRGAL